MTELENELNCCRDSSGRFAPVMTTEELKRYSEMTIRMREIEKQARRNAHMLNFESQLLYILVGFFEKPYVKEAERYLYYDLRRYPRIPYHSVLMSHPVSRNRTNQLPSGLVQPNASASVVFCSLIKRLVGKGWVEHIRHGRKHYLKITGAGMDKIRKHHDYYSRGII